MFNFFHRLFNKNKPTIKSEKTKSNALDTLLKGLEKHQLEDVPGSAFDNAFSIFNKDPKDINLVIIGTNGNITDSRKTNKQWLFERSSDPKYDHLKLGDWGKSRLQPELIRLPDVLNEVFEEQLFSIENTIVTNALLIASAGVSDISNQVKKFNTNSLISFRKNELIKASLAFFEETTLAMSVPKVIFAYGNADTGDSAWCYLRKHFKVLKNGLPIPLSKKTSYKFCTLEINNREVLVIGSPHLSYAYNKLNSSKIKQGIEYIS